MRTVRAGGQPGKIAERQIGSLRNTTEPGVVARLRPTEKLPASKRASPSADWM